MVGFRYIWMVLALLTLQGLGAQEGELAPRRKSDSVLAAARQSQRSTAPGSQPAGLTIADYKIISHGRDTTFLDTTLTIQKEYRYNYLRRDDFELMPFANIGQPYNQLGADLRKNSLFPEIGARARHFNYMEIRDIDYYNVATPLTELFFKTTLEQGQLLDAMLTANFSRRLNVSIAFKGFRSRGKYQQEEVTSGNFRVTANYVTKDGKYRMRAHVAAQDILGQENGGLAQKEVQFESGDADFTDRSRLDVRLNNVQNQVNGKRYYLDHQFRLLGSPPDSLGGERGVFLSHRFAYETKWYQYNQNANTQEYFGTLLFDPAVDQSYLKTMNNRLGLHWQNRVLGKLGGFVHHYDYNYYFDRILITGEQVIPNKLGGSEVLAGALWEKRFGAMALEAEGAIGLAGELAGSYLDASLGIPIGETLQVNAGIHHSARQPDFNTLLYLSAYQNYNWDNSQSFENERVQSLFATLHTQRYGTLEARFTSADNYTYFASTASPEQIQEGQERHFVRPFQEDGRIGYLRLKYQKEFRLGKWALNNTLMYQQVDQDTEVLNLPQFVTRNSLYFSSEVFKKAMFIQTGITFKYFTQYYMNAYNPLIAEFYVQQQEELGGYPMLDFFINAKVRQTRIYLKAEHFNSSFTGNDFYAAPDYPYRDFVIRFGLVWNLFS